MKPILFLDVDGVLLDFETSFIDFFRSKHPGRIPQDYEWIHWNLEKDFPDVDIQALAMEHLQSESFGNMESLVTRHEYLETLFYVEHIHLVTNIPEFAIEKRAENLKNHGIRFTTLNKGGFYNFGEENYPTKMDAIHTVIKEYNYRLDKDRFLFLDDSQHNCTDIKEEFPLFEVYLRSRKHNEGVPYDSRYKRVRDWNQFSSRI